MSTMDEKGYYNPVRVVQTSGWFEACRQGLETLGIESPLIVASDGGVKRLDLASIFSLDSIFSAIMPNPTLRSCQQAIDFSRNRSFDGIIAIGGGSVMDTAKAVKAAIGTDSFDIGEILRNEKVFPNSVPSIFIPTTHGTGSEVTMWGTVWDDRRKRKRSVSYPDLYPDIAILDGSLTASLPLDISLITVLDALSHSFEAIWNRNRNSRSTGYAIDAICMILENVNELKSDLCNVDVRRRLLEAACVAGLAFSNTKTAAAHSISYPLTAYFAIPHGIASSLPLIPLLKINKTAVKNEMDRIYERLRLKGFSHLLEIIEDIPGDSIKYNLKDWGVKFDEIDELVSRSFTPRMDYNIIDLTEHDVKSILEDIYGD